MNVYECNGKNIPPGTGSRHFEVKNMSAPLEEAENNTYFVVYSIFCIIYH